MSTDHHSGLEEVKVLKSSITHITEDSLAYRGISIQELVKKSTYEEVVYLLWNEALPNSKELNLFKSKIVSKMVLDPNILEILHKMPKNAHPQTALLTLFSLFSVYEPVDQRLQESIYSILAVAPVFVCAFERYRKGYSPVLANENFSFAENCLYMLWNEKPDPIFSQALEKSFILYAEHELNASTFATRVTTGTQADIYASIISGIATLKGNLHGGANQKSMEMLLEIDSEDSVKNYIKEKLSNKKRIMGFGHRVYKKQDPRAIILEDLCKTICELKGESKKFRIALCIKNYMKEIKNLNPNVDFYSGLLFYALGFPVDTFTSVFTISRMAGWITHIMEQKDNNRLIRPRAEYTGKIDLLYEDLKRS